MLTMFSSHLPVVLIFLIPAIYSASLKPANNGKVHEASKEHEDSEKPTNKGEDVKAEEAVQDPLGIHFDLADFSDDELIRLAEVMKDELKKYDETEEPVSKLAAEPLVLIPSELVKKPKKHSRSRRSKPHSKLIITEDLPAELLRRITNPEPIIVVPDIDEDVKQNSGPAYITVTEDDLQDDAEDSKSVPMTASEIDEMELRTRIAQLSDLLKERAFRGL
ncbi:hypothetical protein M3Y97_00357600 [Aphelenchoides bicaudatus]|nr:hypothetical protein M3Y97_00357600 [Aphelenchoides bicaudatus]